MAELHRSPRVIRLTLLLGAVVAAMLPILLLRAANPHIKGDSWPCIWAGVSGATGSGLYPSPFSKTDGGCDTFFLDWGSFRGSDGQWYFYDGGNAQAVPVFRFFCTDYEGGSGTCWWADRTSGRHQVSEGGIPSDTYLTLASCVGC